MSIYFYGCISLDGFLADKNHQLQWLYDSGTSEETNYNDFYNQMDITIMGKKTFDAIKDLPDIEAIYPTTKNYVFTHSEIPNMNGFYFINQNIVDFVGQINRALNIWIVGGNTLLKPLLEVNLVDKLIIQIAPVLLGEGIPLFTHKESEKRFYLDSVNQYNQIVELTYSKI